MVLVALGLAFRAPTDYHNRRALPPFHFTGADGRIFTVSDFAGKVVLLDFWATWCQPCRGELPIFDRLQECLGPQGLIVVPVAVDLKGLPAVDDFYAATGVEHLGKYLDPSREAPRAVGFNGLPSALLIDRRGRVAARVEGVANWESGRLAKLMSRLLEER